MAGVNGYFLEGSDGEYLLVIRSLDKEVLYTVIKRMTQMRDPRVKSLGDKLQLEWFEKYEK